MRCQHQQKSTSVIKNLNTETDFRLDHQWSSHLAVGKKLKLSEVGIGAFGLLCLLLCWSGCLAAQVMAEKLFHSQRLWLATGKKQGTWLYIALWS